jgi:hypothetical protein
MMRPFSILFTALFHPLLIPLYGTLFYFQVTPKYSPLEMQSGNVLPVFILTVIIPIFSLLILRNLKMMRSALMLRAEERVYPLLIFLALLLMILFRVIPNNYSEELYYYFLGMIIATTACLILALFGKVISLHMVGMGSLLMYLIALSIHFEKNIVVAISACTLCSGLVGTARLYLRAHGRAAVLTGWLVGVIAQLLLVRFWL